MSTVRRSLMNGKGSNKLPNYLCFTALEDGTFSLRIASNITTSRVEYIEYSTDEGNTWVKTNNVNNQEVTITTPTITTGNKVYWRGKGTQLSSYNSISSTSNYSNFSSTGKFNASGNIYSLIKKGFDADTVCGENYMWCLLFYQSKVVDCGELVLGKMVTNRVYVYDSLFYECTKLTTAPSLSDKTVIGSGCYQNMFRGCTKLVNAPSILPAQTLPTNCYLGMFYGCTSLVTAPEISATTYAQSSFQSTFYGCTNLVNIPDFNGLTADISSFRQTFYGCTSLVNPPKLECTTIGNSCFFEMFAKCTSLISMPELKFTIATQDSCYGMFSGCTSLTTAKKLIATTLSGDQCYRLMFSGCTSLVNVPDDMLSATTLSRNCYMQIFERTGITKSPSLNVATLTASCYQNMFYFAPSLSYIRMLATDISASNCLTNWTNGIPNVSTGIFVKHIDAQWTTTGNNGVPTNWKVIYYDPALDKYYTDQTRATECDDHGNPI